MREAWVGEGGRAGFSECRAWEPARPSGGWGGGPPDSNSVAYQLRVAVSVACGAWQYELAMAAS